MNKKQAAEQISTLFQSIFDRENYTHFLRNLLNDVESRDNHYSGNTVPDAFKQHINQYWRVGEYIDSEEIEMDLYVVEVKSLSKLDRARTALRSFAVSRMLKFGNKDHALIAFYAKEDNGADWRFSYVKIEHTAKLDEKRGKVKLGKELTPAKRYSFLVGEHENSHTAQAQLVDLLAMDYANPTVEDIEKAFSVEKVTKEFFEQYKNLFVRLSEVLQKQAYFQQQTDVDKREQIVAKFAKKLLGQIVFLYFLQKKGWLGVKDGDDWGKGERRFLQKLFADADQADQNYYVEKLQYLFYEALANDRKDQFDPSYYKKFDCKIPFLNGGLFEADYDWQKIRVEIPNTIFSNEEKTKAGDKGTGILDVFDRYNFTIKEDEPLEKEVAVDPEMLGKVFENMLDITERKSKGAFYTPREIVHYMCQESLIHYLNGEVGDNTVTAIPKTYIETLVRKGIFAIENDQRILENGKETDDNALKLPKRIRTHAELIDDKLANIKICDPAIGSGAFPVGMLHEILHARQALAPYLPEAKRLRPYDLKKHTIGHSIYGVDIDPSAIDIARLRLWLSLVVDEDDYSSIDALPNLDYKIMQGNSLIEEYEGVKLFDDAFIEDEDDSLAREKADLKQKQAVAWTNFRTARNAGNKELDAQYDAELNEIDKALKKIVRQEKKLSTEKAAQADGLFDLRNEACRKAKQLEELHQRYFNVSSPKEKRDLRGEITRIEWELIEATLVEQKKIDALAKLANYKTTGEKPWFLWKLNFPEVFKQKSGFDIVIGNPPYIDSESMARMNMNKMREELKNKFQLTRGNWDIYIAFFEQSLSLVRPEACMIFITPDKWLSKPFGAALRQHVHDKLILLVEAGREVFETAKVDAVITAIKNGYTNSFSTGRIHNGQVDKIGEVSPAALSDPYAFDYLFSEHISFISRLDKIERKLMDIAECENACATSNAYELKKILKDGGADFHLTSSQLKVVNTGITGKYSNRWGSSPMTYLKDKYISPYVERDEFLIMFSGAYSKRSLVPKLIVKGLTLLDASIDESGQIIPGKSTLVVTSPKLQRLYFLHLVVNAELPFFYIKEKYRGSSYNQGINFTKHMLNYLPLPNEDSWEESNDCKKLSDYLIFLHKNDSCSKLVCMYFRELVNGVVYELYFPKEIKAAGKEILPHLGELTPLTNAMSEEEKLAVIQREFERLYDPNHPVRNHLETLDSVEEVRIIRDALKK